MSLSLLAVNGPPESPLQLSRARARSPAQIWLRAIPLGYFKERSGWSLKYSLHSFWPNRVKLTAWRVSLGLSVKYNKNIHKFQPRMYECIMHSIIMTKKLVILPAVPSWPHPVVLNWIRLSNLWIGCGRQAGRTDRDKLTLVSRRTRAISLYVNGFRYSGCLMCSAILTIVLLHAGLPFSRISPSRT